MCLCLRMRITNIIFIFEIIKSAAQLYNTRTKISFEKIPPSRSPGTVNTAQTIVETILICSLGYSSFFSRER